MALLFSNLYPETVWVAFAYYDPGCGPANQHFRKLGWWEVAPVSQLEEFEAWDVNVRTVNRFAYFYAESANDGASWSGTGNAWLGVNPASRFEQCAPDDTADSQWVDFVEIDFVEIDCLRDLT